jgi:hypothetical protein
VDSSTGKVLSPEKISQEYRFGAALRCLTSTRRWRATDDPYIQLNSRKALRLGSEDNIDVDGLVPVSGDVRLQVIPRSLKDISAATEGLVKIEQTPPSQNRKVGNLDSASRRNRDDLRLPAPPPSIQATGALLLVQGD